MTFEQYIASIDEKWQSGFKQLWAVVSENIPEDFEVGFQHGMPCFQVPLDKYPKGYHVDSTPLPLISMAAQKRHLAVYHMGLYRDDDLYEWFKAEYPKYMTSKLNMGKSCIRFTNPQNIPFDLIGELAGKMGVDDWIRLYESSKPL